MGKDSDSQFIDAREMTLEEWLGLLSSPPSGVIFVDYGFPSREHQDEYLASIDKRSEEEVYKLLEHFLIPSCTLGSDEWSLRKLWKIRESNPESFRQMMQDRHNKRLIDYVESGFNFLPWEGITWILDLLPRWPRYALQALNAYFLAHCQHLPDGRLGGLSHAATVIRAKFIGLPGKQSELIQFLMNLSSDEFECVVAELYREMGYKTELTSPKKDGGRDVIALQKKAGHTESLRIECKRYRKPVGVAIARALLGVVSSEKANKGVLATTSRFTAGTQKFADENPRLELLDGDQLVRLLNEHLGTKWPLHIERYVAESSNIPSSEIAPDSKR
jgi:restriction system protein